MMAPALSETEDRLWYHHQRALVDHLWMHFIICKSISLSVEVIFSQSKVGCNQSSDSLSRISFNIFFSEFISVIGKRLLGQPCLGEADSQMHTFDNHEEFEFCETPGIKKLCSISWCWSAHWRPPEGQLRCESQHGPITLRNGHDMHCIAWAFDKFPCHYNLILHPSLSACQSFWFAQNLGALEISYFPINCYFHELLAGSEYQFTFYLSVMDKMN